MERSRSPRRSLQCFVDAHLSSLHQRDRRALQHLRSQIQLVNQWRQVGVLAEAWELLKEQVLSLTVDHPDTLNFRGTFQCLASDMSAIFDNATGQAHDAELALEYLISKLSDTCADQRITSHQQHPNPILALQPGGQTRFRTSTELQCSGPQFFFLSKIRSQPLNLSLRFAGIDARPSVSSSWTNRKRHKISKVDLGARLS